MHKKFQKIINLNKKNKEFKVNYEQLKQYLHYEDVFFKLMIEPVLKNENMDFEFKGQYMILRRRD